MGFETRKISDGDISSQGVQHADNKLTGSALENKKVFDNLIDAVVQPKFNGLIDDLKDTTAADDIGVSVTGLTSTKLSEALLEIKTIADNATTGTITPGSITGGESGMLAAELPIGPQLSGVLPANVGIKMGTSYPTTADISEGEIYLKYSV